MPRTVTLIVRVGEALSEFVATMLVRMELMTMSANLSDLNRRDRERAETEGFERLKAELVNAFAAPESSYAVLDAETLIARNARA